MKKIPTLEEAMETYIEKRSIKATTAFNYRRNIRHCCKDWLAMPVTEITKGMIIERHQDEQYGAVSVDNALRALRAILNWASEYFADGDEPLLASIPTERLKALKMWRKPKPRLDDRIEIEDVGRWLHAVRKLHHTPRDYLTLLLLTGCRKSEGLMLRYEDIDFSKGLLTLDCADELTKNNTRHVLPLSTQLLDMLWCRRLTNDVAYRADWVFPNQYNSGPMTSPASAMRAVKSETGIPFACHTLRRSFVLLATHPRVQADEVSLKAILNHAHTGVTWRHYLKPDPERLRTTIQGVSDLVYDLAGVSWMDSRFLSY